MLALQEAVFLYSELRIVREPLGNYAIPVERDVPRAPVPCTKTSIPLGRRGGAERAARDPICACMYVCLSVCLSVCMYVCMCV